MGTILSAPPILLPTTMHPTMCESSPLMSSGTEIATHVFFVTEAPQITAFIPKGRIILLLCAFAFIMKLGDDLQPGALTQLLKIVICDNYNIHALPLAGRTTDQCKG